MSVDEMSVDEVSYTDEMSVDELSWNPKLGMRIQQFCKCSGPSNFEQGIPRDRGVLSANVDGEQKPRMLLTWSETESL